LLADTGYFSEAEVALCAAAQIDPIMRRAASRIIRPCRSALPVPWAPENPTPLQAMSHRLQTPEGKKLCIASAKAALRDAMEVKT